MFSAMLMDMGIEWPPLLVRDDVVDENIDIMIEIEYFLEKKYQNICAKVGGQS